MIWPRGARRSSRPACGRSLRSRDIKFKSAKSGLAALRRGGGGRKTDEGDVAGTRVILRGLRNESSGVSGHEFSVRDANDRMGTARVSFLAQQPNGTPLRRHESLAFKISYNLYHVISDEVPDEESIRAFSNNIGQDCAGRMDNHHNWAR